MPRNIQYDNVDYFENDSHEEEELSDDSVKYNNKQMLFMRELNIYS